MWRILISYLRLRLGRHLPLHLRPVPEQSGLLRSNGAVLRTGRCVDGGLGHMGWTQWMDAGEMLADIIAGRLPAIDPAPCRLDR